MRDALCLLLLRHAARRWANGNEMLAEWRAELSIMDSGRLRYAASLALSRPNRIRTAHTGPAIVNSFLLLIAVPLVYPIIVETWLPWAAAACLVTLGAVAARLTAGVTNMIKPTLLSSWVFGVPCLLMLLFVTPEQLDWRLLYVIPWLAAAVVCGIAAVRLTQRGHTAIAWVFIAVAAPVVFLLTLAPILVGFPNVLGYPDIDAITIVARLAAQPVLHLILFGFVYIQGLATARFRRPTPSFP